MSRIIIFPLLVLMVSGCDTVIHREAIHDTVINASIPEVPITDDYEEDHKQILEVRLDFQEQVLFECKSLRSISDRLFEEETDLYQLIKSANTATLEEAIELFREGRYENIPRELWVAYSCFQRTLSTKIQQLIVITRIERWQATGYLEKLDDFIEYNHPSSPEINQWLTSILRNWHRDDSKIDTYKMQAIDGILNSLIFWESTCP